MSDRGPSPRPAPGQPRSPLPARLSRVSPLPRTPFTARLDRLSRPDPIRSRGPPRTPFTARLDRLSRPDPIRSRGPPRTPFTARPIASPGPPRTPFTGRLDPFPRPDRSRGPPRTPFTARLDRLPRPASLPPPTPPAWPVLYASSAARLALFPLALFSARLGFLTICFRFHGSIVGIR